MKNRFTWFGLMGLALAGSDARAGVRTFNKDIRPILSAKCFSCHGFDAKNRKANLRLDTLEGAQGAGKSGAVAIRPGDVPGSELWKRIQSADADEVMPPPDSHKVLTAAEKEILQEWIAQGAGYQKHWAFEAPVKPEVPPMPVWMTGRNEVDRFIFDRLKTEAQTPLPEADKETLIRRVTFALTGLPPSLAEVEPFLSDASPDAYEKCVDRLLATPAYGEQMARHWLDVARYGDTHGLHLDNERSMWLYRDWVVGAFNRNLPFDQFSIEQLAGDLLPEPTQDQLTATGFNRCNVTTGEGGAIDAEFTFRYAVERTSTTAQTWLGLTAGCAQCHDHKYDPVSQKEFYQLYAFFLSAADPAMDGNTLLTAPVMKRTLPEQAAQLAEYDAKIAAAEKGRQAVVDALVYTDPASLVPLPPVKVEERVLVEDNLPDTAKTRSQPVWVTNPPGPVASGQRALKVSGKAVTQDFCEEMNPPAVVPAGAVFSCQVFISGSETPKAVMLQFNTNGWKHRAMWGDPAAIPGWGAPDTGERFIAGSLPAVEGWQTLEVDAAKLGLKAGDPITGIAFTLEGGTAWFDLLKLTGHVDDAKDESKSYSAWLAAREGKETGGLPAEVNQILGKVPAGTRNDAQKKQVRDYYLMNVCSLTKPALAPAEEELAKLKKQRGDLDGAIPSTFIMKDLDTPRDSFIMIRGAYDKPGEKVQRDVPVAFPPLPKKEKPNRLDLARWLVDGQNPLSARVTVNRFWQQVFGTGLVKTSGDFGSQGQPPSHPELLDWLAVTFRESGWDVKRLMRLLVTSAAFRQSSAAPEALWKRDPENRLLARGPRLRLDAEEVRDNALALSGLLKTRMGGAGVRPYQPPNIWEPVGFDGSNTRNYVQDKGDSLYRRSLYAFIKRTAPPPFMVNFDAPSREQSCTVRERSNTPMQALQLMNDVQHVEAARGLAGRLMTEGGDTPEARITFGCRTVLGRRPSSEELAIIRVALQEHLAKYSVAPAEAAKLIRQGESPPPPGLAEPELAAWTLVANLLLNLDETITRN
jgi:cytochrome c553